MGNSNKPYKELRAVMDAHGFVLLEIARDGRERWAGLTWTEDRPLVIRPGVDARTSVNLIRQIRKAAGEETTDRAKKRDAKAIKERRAAERERARTVEASKDAEREKLAAQRGNTVAEGVNAVLTRHTARQLLAQQSATVGEAARREAARERELAEIDRLMRSVPTGH